MRMLDRRSLFWLWLAILSLIVTAKYSGTLIATFSMFFRILLPFIIGAMIAFVVNILMGGMERHFYAQFKMRMKRGISILLSYFIILLIVILIVGAIVPQIASAVSDLIQNIPISVQELIAWIRSQNIDNTLETEILSRLQSVNLNWNAIIDRVQGFLQSGFTNVTSLIIGATNSMIGVIVNTAVAIIFSIYILASKERLQRQADILLRAYFPEKLRRSVLRVASLLYINFSSFIKVQCLEACIFGLLFIVFMSILKLPYAIMIGVLIAFMALIPVVGSFLGCFTGFFMILIIDPLQAFIFLILFVIIQQIDVNLIYPRVVGKAVGLPAMWILLAVSLGASFLGIIGILLFIPLLSTIYTLLKEDAQARLDRKEAKSLQE